MDADQSPHPPWCSQRRCTAGTRPVNGHAGGMDRSAPEAAGLTEVYLTQTPEAGSPSVEITRSGRSVPLPLLEAKGLPDALGDLLRQTGVAP